MGYILKDMEKKEGDMKNKDLDEFREKNRGLLVCDPPENQDTLINFTGPAGSTTGVYYSLMFQLRKWNYDVQKASEWIEVSPVHQQYYQLTHKQKEELENKIKAGLASAAQAVSDMELLEHDMRKYQEFIDYFNYTVIEKTGDVIDKPMPDKKKEKDEWENWEKGRISGEHSLKAIFIDQVDFHAGSSGQGAGRLSMSFMQQQNIMPTIVQDFFEMDGLDNLEKNPRLKNLPTVEKNMLKTKWIAYEEWKKLFGNEIKKRFKNIYRLVQSRRQSVEKYRDWLKPYVARHKILEEGFESPGERMGTLTSFVHSTGQAVSSDGLEIWAWREFIAPELYRTPGELTAKARLEGVVPWDDWTIDNLVLDPEQGLKAEYDWIDKDWVWEKTEDIKKKGWLADARPYYSFFIITYDKTNIKFATGSELEDANYIINHYLLSQNVLFVKLLELLAKQDEMERYINSLLGLPKTGEMKPDKAEEEYLESLKKEKEKKKEKKPLIPKSAKAGPKKFLKFFNLKFQFFKKGPYERDFESRIAKAFLKPMGSERFIPVVGFIKEKIGFAQ